MKKRTDFVSNSSSSSFVIAINDTYPIAQFAKDLAKNSVNKKDEFHDKNLQSLNETTLNFCLNNYELLFLGSWIVGTHESTINYDEVLEIHGPKFAESEFSEICDEVNRKNKRNETAANGKADYIDDNKTVHWFVDDIVEQVAVTSHQMEYDFSKEYIKSEDDLFNNLKSAAETYAKAEQHPMCTVYSVPEIYQISKNCFHNTK